MGFVMSAGVVEVRRAKKGLFKRNQFRLVLRFHNREVFLHSETYTNHAYLVDVGRDLAAAIGWDFMDTTGIGGYAFDDIGNGTIWGRNV